MQALMLAAGMGNRLGKYTRENTKCMLTINGVTLIEHALEVLNNLGISKLVLVVGYKRDNLIEFLGTKYKNVNIEYVVNPVYDTTNNIYSLYLAKDFLLADDTILLESDLIFQESIVADLLHDARPNLAVVDKYESWMDGTVVKLDQQDNITNFIPKKFFDYDEIDKYFKTVNIYKFSRAFSEKTYVPFLHAYASALGHNEYYEQVLRVIVTLEDNDLKAMRLCGAKWYEIDDVQDKDNAETIFAPDASVKLQRVQKRYGGYWRYPYLKDFCYLVNPYFPTTTMENEMRSCFNRLLSEYPSGSYVQNLLAAKMFNIEPQDVIVGNGAAELIRAMAKCVDGSFGIVFPTFNEYPESIGIERVVKLVVDRLDFSYTCKDLLELSRKCDNLLLINPDNPSGHFIKKEELLHIAQELKDTGKRFIVDESFVDFSHAGEDATLLDSSILQKFDNLIVIKSISKSYGVPGARLGVLASADQDLIKKVQREVSIWNINSFGEFFLQVFGKYRNEYKEACCKIKSERNRFFKELSKLSFLTVIPSEANFFLCEVTGRFTAKSFTEFLIERHDVYIKDLTGKVGFEGKQFVRIAVRDFHDNDFLINIFAGINAYDAVQTEVLL